jgi:hypothetical protein
MDISVRQHHLLLLLPLLLLLSLLLLLLNLFIFIIFSLDVNNYDTILRHPLFEVCGNEVRRHLERNDFT